MIGTTFPSFTLQAYHAGRERTISDADLLDRWTVLFFYPADFTFVCPTELADLADQYETFNQLGVEIYAISTDTHYWHKAWHDQSERVGRVCFPLVGDPAGVLCRHYGILDPASGLAMRATFLINPLGRVMFGEVLDDGIGRSARELLRKIEAAQYVHRNGGEVCPAAWEPGQATLAPSLALAGSL